MDLCDRCLKPINYCLCHLLKPQDTDTEILILQHPQEPDKLLGTARLAHLSLPKSKLCVGLSWPNLSQALGRKVDPSEWLVLYLGSIKNIPDRLTVINGKGKVLPGSPELFEKIKGLVVLDGTWSQAKTLWWRNAWLLKLNRAVLLPKNPSLYHKARKEPRRECVSTIEAIGAALVELENDSFNYEQLIRPMNELLKLYKPQKLAKRPRVFRRRKARKS